MEVSGAVETDRHKAAVRAAGLDGWGSGKAGSEPVCFYCRCPNRSHPLFVRMGGGHYCVMIPLIVGQRGHRCKLERVGVKLLRDTVYLCPRSVSSTELRLYAMKLYLFTLYSMLAC